MGSDFGELELCSQKPQSRSPVVNAQRGKRYAVLSNRRTRKSFETHVDSIIRYKSYNRTSLLEYADLSISHYTPLLGLNWRRRTSTFDPGQSANLSERELVSLAVSSPRKDLRALATALRKEIRSDHDGEGAEEDLKQVQESSPPTTRRCEALRQCAPVEELPSQVCVAYAADLLVRARTDLSPRATRDLAATGRNRVSYTVF